MILEKIKVDSTSTDNIPIQIVNQIKQMIMNGELDVGYRFPSYREFVDKLHVSMTSIQKTFSLLAQENIVVRKPKLGTFITSNITGSSMPSSVERRGERQLMDFQAAILMVENWATNYERRSVLDEFEATISAHGGKTTIIKYNMIENRNSNLQQLEPMLSSLDMIFYIDDGRQNENLIWDLKKINIPLFTMNYYGNLAVSKTLDDSAWPIEEVLRYLIKLNHRRIAFLSFRSSKELYSDHSWVNEREAAFLKIAKIEGLPINCNDIYITSRNNDKIDFPTVGKNAGKTLLPELAKHYTAIIAINDQIAIGFLEIARKYGLQVPESFSLIGFDNDDEAKEYGLTTVQHPYREHGSEAARALIKMYLNPNVPQLYHVVNKPKIIFRNSVAKVEVKDNFETKKMLAESCI